MIGFVYTLQIVCNYYESDFQAHQLFAESMYDSGKLVAPHFLYHFLVIGISKGLHVSFNIAAIIINFISVFLVAIVALLLFKNNKSSLISDNVAIVATIILMFSHPPTLLYVINGFMYLGYIVPNAYHNPTILLLKPIALLSFYLICNILDQHFDIKKDFSMFLLSIVFVLLSIIAKPSFIIILLPAIYIYICCEMLYSQNVKRLIFIALAISIPAIIVLSLQFNMAYVSTSSGIKLGFFEVFRARVEEWAIPLNLLLSIVVFYMK